MNFLDCLHLQLLKFHTMALSLCPRHVPQIDVVSMTWRWLRGGFSGAPFWGVLWGSNWSYEQWSLYWKPQVTLIERVTLFFSLRKMWVILLKGNSIVQD